MKTNNTPAPYLKIQRMKKSYTTISNLIQLRSFALCCTIFFCLGQNNLHSQDPCFDNCDIINLACNSSINVSVNEDCYAAVTTDLILEDAPFGYCPDSPTYYDIVLHDESGNYIPGHIIGFQHVGQRIKASITLKPCSISCWGYINVEDKVGPKIQGCQDGYLPPVILDCEEYGNGIGPDYPHVYGICNYNFDYLSFKDDTSNVMCTNGYAVSILREWTAIDDQGFKDKCRQEIYVEKYILKDVVFPSDYIREYSDDCDIFENVSPELTGYPTGVFCPNMQFYYNDIVYKQCGAQRKLLRDWSVLDWCTGESVTKGQIIKIIDNTPPIVECPADSVWYPQDWYRCITDVVLDPYGLYDSLTIIKVANECSLPLSVKVDYFKLRGGHNPGGLGDYYPVIMTEDSTFIIENISESVRVRYCYSDDCGNQSTYTEEMPELIDSNLTSACCYFDVVIEDQQAPTAICEGYTKVQLTSTGETEISAEVFDDSSYDPCNDISHFEVKRENSSCPGYKEHGVKDWGPSVHFCCQDLGKTLTIRLRAIDHKGNYSECLGLVNVRSHATTQVECPDDIDLDCGDNYSDRDLIGLPTGENGCNSSIHIGDDWFDISDYNISCGTGMIIRTVDVLDEDGNILRNCSQRIIIDPANNSDYLEPGDFDFPIDITIDECAFGPNTHPDFTGKPVPNKLFDCTNIAVSYKDDSPLTSNQNGVCYTILRRWKVVDWCRFNPDYPSSFTLEAVQEISISNSGTAVFTCPQQTVVVNSNNANCEAFVDLGVFISNTCGANMDVSWEIDAFTNGTIDYLGNGDDASDIFPAGRHLITYSATNHCGGGSNSCTFQFEVNTDKAPTAICRSELIWTINADHEAEVWASDFDLKSIGGCDSNDILSFSFVSPEDASYPQNSRVFTCEDLPDGQFESLIMDIYVIDESELYSSCNVTLHLQDNFDHCPDQGGMMAVEGEIMTEIHEPVEEVMVELKDLEDNGIMMDMTSEMGNYAFEDVEMSGQYIIAPYNNDDPLKGVSTLDLLLIQKHILGQQKLNSPYKLIAADIDANGSISAIDLIQLRKLILGVIDEYPYNDSWAFVPQSYQFADPLNPWNYPSTIDLDNIEDQSMTADFVGVKIGDVNNSLYLSTSQKILSGSDQSFYLSTDNVGFNAGDLVSVPIRVSREIITHGMQFTIKFSEEAFLFEGIDRGFIDLGQENFALLNTKKGLITISFTDVEMYELNEDELLFTLYFESKVDGVLSDYFEINSDVTKAELYTESFNVEKINLVMYDRQMPINNELEVFQNEPNPFSESTSIAFSIPKRQKVSLSVFDANGRLMDYQSEYFDKGINEFIINALDIKSNGILFYRVESQSSIITRKMIVVK